MAKEKKSKSKAKAKKKKKESAKTIVSPGKAAKLLVKVYGDELDITEANGAATFTKGELDRMKRWSQGDPVLSKAVRILQGQASMKKGPVNGVINALSLRPTRRR